MSHFVRARGGCTAAISCGRDAATTPPPPPPLLFCFCSCSSPLTPPPTPLICVVVVVSVGMERYNRNNNNINNNDDYDDDPFGRWCPYLTSVISVSELCRHAMPCTALLGGTAPPALGCTNRFLRRCRHWSQKPSSWLAFPDRKNSISTRLHAKTSRNLKEKIKSKPVVSK